MKFERSFSIKEWKKKWEQRNPGKDIESINFSDLMELRSWENRCRKCNWFFDHISGKCKRCESTYNRKYYEKRKD